MIQKYREALKWAGKILVWIVILTLFATIVEPLLFPWWVRTAANALFLFGVSMWVVLVTDAWWIHKRNREDEITRALSTFLQTATSYVLMRRDRENVQQPLDANLYRAAADYLSILRLKEASSDDAEIDRRASAKLLEVLERVKKEETGNGPH
jgi:hypothetical protein